VGDFKVGRGVDGTRSGGVELRVGKREGAVPTSGTAGVEQRQDVLTAADVAEVALDAATQSHATVASSANEDHVTVTTTGTGDVDRLHVAELADDQWRSCNAVNRLDCARAGFKVRGLEAVGSAHQLLAQGVSWVVD